MRRILGQPLQKAKTVTGSRGATGSVGVGLGLSWAFPAPVLPRSNLHSGLLRHWSLPEQRIAVKPSQCGSAEGFYRGDKAGRWRAASWEEQKAALSTLPSLAAGGELQEHIPCVWGDNWDICGEEKPVKSIVLNVLDTSREKWLQPWLVKHCPWGLEAFSLLSENPSCVKLFNTHDSIDLKVDNHHWALNTQSMLLELQLFFVNTNIKYLFWIRMI